MCLDERVKESEEKRRWGGFRSGCSHHRVVIQKDRRIFKDVRNPPRSGHWHGCQTVSTVSVKKRYGKKGCEVSAYTDTRSYDIIGSISPNLSTDNTGAGHQAMSAPGYRSSHGANVPVSS